MYWPVAKEIPFKDITILTLVANFLNQAERSDQIYFGRGHHKEHFCEINLNLDLWFRRKCRLKTYLI